MTDSPTKDTIVPAWADCCLKETKHLPLTALEQFVLDNEPADPEGEREFRTGLAAVIAEVRS